MQQNYISTKYKNTGLFTYFELVYFWNRGQIH